MNFNNPVLNFLSILFIFLCMPFAASADFDDDDEDVDYFGGLDKFLESQTADFGTSFFTNADPQIPKSYTAAKAMLYHRVKDAKSLYCGCNTAVNGDDELYDRSSCGFVPINDNSVAKVLEAEHVLPASLIIRYDPDSTCYKSDQCREGESARNCCKRLDEKFNRAHNDLVNLYPAVGTINRARSNNVFDDIPNEDYRFGTCNFETDRTFDTAEPRDGVRGDIARIHFYMIKTYGLELPEWLEDRLEIWDEEDPIDDIERERNDLILEIQGTANDMIE